MQLFYLETSYLHFRNVNDDLASSSAMSVASHAVNPVVVAAGAAGASTITKSNSNDKLNLDEQCEDQQKIVDKEILKNGDACNTDNVDIDAEDQAYHNASTMRYRKKNGSNNTDLDSIEHLDFDDEDKKNEGLDDMDSVRRFSNPFIGLAWYASMASFVNLLTATLSI